MMRQIRVNPVRYQIIQELAKKDKKTIENYIGDVIDHLYSGKIK